MTDKIFDLETLLLSHYEIKKRSLQTPLLPVVGFPETKFHQKSDKRCGLHRFSKTIFLKRDENIFGL